ncbi:MAG: hypothetical protein DHS20C06_18090 [Hyphobacterium sp.]|nr:MAG: hypothetical protein DHS20C06_18090 [Hyphobacterium sp.]
MIRNETPFSPAKALQMIRLLPAPILAAIGGFAAAKALGITTPWPEVIAAIAGGYVLGVVARRTSFKTQ